MKVTLPAEVIQCISANIIEPVEAKLRELHK
jgi:hypothetical protein